MKDHAELKKKSYSPKMSGSDRAKSDRKRVKKFKSPDVNKKKYRFYDEKSRCWFYADTKKKLEAMKDALINIDSK